jgi:predicted MFS family arabinose efflux permease
LLLGGLITNYFSWRWVLFVNVPIGVMLAIAAPRVLAATHGRPGRLDLPRAATVTVGSLVAAVVCLPPSWLSSSAARSR